MQHLHELSPIEIQAIYQTIPPYEALPPAQEHPPYRLWGFILCTLFVLMLAGYISPLTVLIVLFAAFFHAVL